MNWSLLIVFFVSTGFRKSTLLDRFLSKLSHDKLQNNACSIRKKQLTVFFHKNDWGFFPTETDLCTHTCKIVDEQENADIILWHVHTQMEPKNLKNSQVLIAIGVEASRELDRFNNPRVNYTSSFRFNSDIVYPYVNNLMYENFEKESVPDENTFNQMKLAVFINSNCVGFRNQFVKNLMELIPIESRGICLNNAPRLPGGWPTVGQNIKNQYKFYIAMENTNKPYYVSEKFYTGYLANAVPIYYGAKEADIFAPKESFIRIESLESYEQIAQEILKISKNYTLWKEMYESRRQSFPYKTQIIDWVLNTRHLNDTHTTGNLCRFCDYVCHNNF